MSDTGGDSGRKTKIDMKYQEFERILRELLPSSQQAFHMSDRFEEIIPADDRRRVWQELRVDGIDLPELQLSAQVFIIAAVMVLAPVFLLALSLRRWSMLLSLVELSLIAHRLTRPLAIYPPMGCETVYEAVLHLTRFSHEDYRAGLWTREEIAAKVRQIFAEEAGVPLEDVQEQTTVEKLFGSC